MVKLDRLFWESKNIIDDKNNLFLFYYLSDKYKKYIESIQDNVEDRQLMYGEEDDENIPF